jgi:uncharacterized membrane protein YdjX (TVP38/TMEM64 family)
MKSWRRAAIAFVLFGGVALPAVILAFAALAFLGVPQVVLIAAAVAAFGPWTGLAYSWTGTMVSALMGFVLGRTIGTRLIEGWPGAQRFADLIGRNGFMASLVVRLAPFAPFVLVNITAGVTSMSILAFASGTAIGILPKIAVIAFAGHSVIAGGAWAWLALALAVWAAAGLAARRWLRR